MTFLKKLILGLAAAFALSGQANAAGEGVAWDKFPAQRITDMAALQNGAKLFVNYCLNCHAAAFMRYNRLRDIGLTDEQIRDNLVFTERGVGDTMEINMAARDARDWFGGVPPDLTLIARSRSSHSQGPGADYLYTFLRSYYRDYDTPTGWNNRAFPGVGMPHVLWELQGQRLAIYEEPASGGDPEFVRYQTITPGTMSALEYDNAVADLVAFLQWMGEPVQQQRKRLGVWVLLFLSAFIFIAWRLNAAFWKDIK